MEHFYNKSPIGGPFLSVFIDKKSPRSLNPTLPPVIALQEKYGKLMQKDYYATMFTK